MGDCITFIKSLTAVVYVEIEYSVLWYKLLYYY